jgi:hypothetical protein
MLEPAGQAQTAALVAPIPRATPPDFHALLLSKQPAVAHQPLLPDPIAAASIDAFAAPSSRFVLSVVHRI